ncbi:hydroxymethylbilane synthase [Trueperella bialowiezensis]|uniref:Hydroxymethylbilane synthase n=1 Tax=Trueperella bialowiezensis TaxID=312285 RepID=A0A3S4VTI5_9ACTO|nr:hydroxymethylbilane synthase [Trueperella bialowiezensis]VEI13386.1 Porphobilinogen deaminase [Trueperella bialowiezensis]
MSEMNDDAARQVPRAPRVLRVGTRTSDLALTQAKATAQLIVDAGADSGSGSPDGLGSPGGVDMRVSGYEIVGITTRGDVDRAPLEKIGGTGLFTSAVRQAILAGECDVAIHSAKDLPAADHPDLAIYYPLRANPADVLCASVPFAELPQGARIGTGSPRRRAQLLARRPDLDVVAIRGNVPTRLARAGDDLDGVILARAGLERLGLDVGEDLDPTIMIPAAAQGALAIETARGSEWEQILARVDHGPTRREVTAERAFMRLIGAGCTTPVGVLATDSGGQLSVRARYVDAEEHVEHEVTGPDPLDCASELAEHFLAAGVGNR